MRWAHLALLLSARGGLGGADLILPGKRCHQVSGKCRPSQDAVIRPDVEPPDPTPPKAAAKPQPRKLQDDAQNATDPCTEYLSQADCGWTMDYSCPGQPKGAQGDADDDGTVGYTCCCTQEAWKQAAKPTAQLKGSPPPVSGNPCESGEVIDDSIACGLGYVDGAWGAQVCCVPKDGKAKTQQSQKTPKPGAPSKPAPPTDEELEETIMPGAPSKPAPPTDEELEKTPMPGAPSKLAPPTDEELEVWKAVPLSNSTCKGSNVDLASLGDPVSVTSQVVAGINYNFTFSDGTVVSVFAQPWTDTLEIKGCASPQSATSLEDKAQVFRGSLLGGRGQGASWGPDLTECVSLAGVSLLVATLAGRFGARAARAGAPRRDADEAQTSMLRAGNSGEGL